MIKKTAQYGDLEVPDNFDELSPEEQQKELRKAAAGKQKISPQLGSMSALEQAQGVLAESLQGLTIGTSDEIKAALAEAFNLPKTIFTEQEFGETYTRVKEKEKKELEEYARLYPKSAIAANIAGSVLPIAASTLLGGPGGTAATTGTTAARAKQILDSSRLLAGGMTKPGASLTKKMVEGAKMGGAQGAVGAVGYSQESDPLTLSGQAAGGAVLGGLLGASVPPTLKASGYVLNKLSQPIVQTYKKIFTPDSAKVNFTKNEIEQIKSISTDFLQDEIDIDQIISKISNNISADKLEGVTPVEILADYGGDAVRKKLRAMNLEIPGGRIKETLVERGTGSVEAKGKDLLQDRVSNIQSTRIISSLKNSANKVIKTKGINLEGGVDGLSKAIQKKVGPLYDVAYQNNRAVDNLNVYRYLEVPVIKEAYEKARKNYLLETINKNPGIGISTADEIGIPPLKNLLIKNENGQIVDVTKKLPLAFLDQIKRSADGTTFALKRATDRSKITSREAGNRKNIANQFRDLLKNSVNGDEYADALSQAADNFALKEAYELGQKSKVLSKTKTGNVFSQEYENLKTTVEKDAFKMGVFNNILDGINAMTDSSNLAEKLTNNPALRDKIQILFSGTDGFEGFINRLGREDQIAQTGKDVLRGTSQQFGDDRGGFLQFLSDLFVAGSEPTGSAGIRSQAKIAGQTRDILFDTGTKNQKAFQDIMLSQDPKKQQDILKLMKQLQKTQISEAEKSNILRSSLIRSTAPSSIETLNQTLFDE
jgi:hypothetical protein